MDSITLNSSLFACYRQYKRSTKKVTDFLVKFGSKNGPKAGRVPLSYLEQCAQKICQKKTRLPLEIDAEFRKTISLRMKLSTFFRTTEGEATSTATKTHEHFTQALLDIYNQIGASCPAPKATLKKQTSSRTKTTKRPKKLLPTNTFEVLSLDNLRMDDTEDQSSISANPSSLSNHKTLVDIDEDEQDETAIEGDSVLELLDGIETLMKFDQLCAVTRMSFAKAGKKQLALSVATAVMAVAHTQAQSLARRLVQRSDIRTVEGLWELTANCNLPTVADLVKQSPLYNNQYDLCTFHDGLRGPWLVLNDYSDSASDSFEREIAEAARAPCTARSLTQLDGDDVCFHCAARLQQFSSCLIISPNVCQQSPNVAEDISLMKDILRNVLSDNWRGNFLECTNYIACYLEHGIEGFVSDEERIAKEITRAFGLRLMVEGLRSFVHGESRSTVVQVQPDDCPAEHSRLGSDSGDDIELASSILYQRMRDAVNEDRLQAYDFGIGCREQLFSFAQEVKESLSSCLAHPCKIPTCCISSLGDQFKTLMAGLDNITPAVEKNPYDVRLYCHLPATAGAYQSFIQSRLFFYGLKLTSFRHYIASVLHVYNVLVHFSVVDKIPVLEELCQFFLNSIFLGDRPAKNFESRYVRFCGGRLHTGKDGHGLKWGSNSTWGMTMDHSGRSEDIHNIYTAGKSNRFDAAQLSLNSVVAQPLRELRQEDWSRVRCDKKYYNTTRKERAAVQSWLDNPTISDHPLSLLQDRLQAEYEGGFPVAKINFYSIWEACANIFCAVSIWWHAQPDLFGAERNQSPEQVYSSNCIALETVMRADEQLSGRYPGLKVYKEKLTEEWKRAIEVEFDGKTIKDFVWKSL